MKKAQAIRLWIELEASTEAEEIIRKYQNKKGYASRRTLQRYVQAAKGFREVLPLDELAKRAGWSATYLEKIRPWWEEARRERRQHGVKPTETDPHQEALRDMAKHLLHWVEDSSTSGPPTDIEPIVVPYEGRKQPILYRVESNPAYEALAEHLGGLELWKDFHSYVTVRRDYWFQKLSLTSSVVDPQLWQEMLRLQRQVSREFKELLLGREIPGRCRGC